MKQQQQQPPHWRSEPEFQDGPSYSCCGAPCLHSQIWLWRMLIVMPPLYAVWYLLALIFLAGFSALPVSGLEPFKHEQFLLVPNATESNAAVALAYVVGRYDDGSAEYRPLVAWICMVLAHNLVAPWFVYIGAHDPERVVDYCIILQIVHLILTTGITGDIPRTPVWWVTSAISFLVQSQLSTFLIFRMGVGRAVWVRRVARGPLGARNAMPIAVSADDPQPFKFVGGEPVDKASMVALPPMPSRRDIASGSYASASVP